MDIRFERIEDMCKQCPPYDTILNAHSQETRPLVAQFLCQSIWLARPLFATSSVGRDAPNDVDRKLDRPVA
jgi:hypothetical protein